MPQIKPPIVVTTKARLARSGFELIKWLVELSGGHIEILDDSNGSGEVFDTSELIGFITSFCNSHYGKRSAEGRSYNLAVDRFRNDKYKDENGKFINMRPSIKSQVE